MVSKKVLRLLNEQITLEDESSQIYLAMATWAEVKGFLGTAKFMYRQAEEERSHMHKFIKFINDLTEHAEISGVKAPKANYRDIEDIFKDALKHEQMITASINNIVTAARGNNDNAVVSFLKWFVDEQVEEEGTVKRVLDIIKMAGEVSIYLADKEIGALRGDK